MSLLFFLAIAILLVVIGVSVTRVVKRDLNELLSKINVKPVEIDIAGTEARLDKKISGLPNIITNSITGSANTQKGKLGELIGYLSMKAEYDRIIPLGSIVDFMGIKFPTDTEEGYVHFIDIKTGKHARLTTDQRNLKALLSKEAISFKTIRVDEI